MWRPYTHNREICQVSYTVKYRFFSLKDTAGALDSGACLLSPDPE
jgi:hypothetical protein